ncbi:MAG: hypothetical protein R3B69_01275 [Candidatus Paceibacterota bacterium]
MNSSLTNPPQAAVEAGVAVIRALADHFDINVTPTTVRPHFKGPNEGVALAQAVLDSYRPGVQTSPANRSLGTISTQPTTEQTEQTEQTGLVSDTATTFNEAVVELGVRTANIAAKLNEANLTATERVALSSELDALNNVADSLDRAQRELSSGNTQQATEAITRAQNQLDQNINNDEQNTGLAIGLGAIGIALALSLLGSLFGGRLSNQQNIDPDDPDADGGGGRSGTSDPFGGAFSPQREFSYRTATIFGVIPVLALLTTLVQQALQQSDDDLPAGSIQQNQEITVATNLAYDPDTNSTNNPGAQNTNNPGGNSKTGGWLSKLGIVKTPYATSTAYIQNTEVVEVGIVKDIQTGEIVISRDVGEGYLNYFGTDDSLITSTTSLYAIANHIVLNEYNEVVYSDGVYAPVTIDGIQYMLPGDPEYVYVVTYTDNGVPVQIENNAGVVEESFLENALLIKCLLMMENLHNMKSYRLPVH